MSIRHQILAALAKRPTEMQTIEDLQDATGAARHKSAGIQYNGKPQAENLAKSPREKTAPAPTAPSPTESDLMAYIYDIRRAIGDPEGKIMLSDMAETIAKIKTEHDQAYETLAGIAHALRGSGLEGLRNTQPSLGLQTEVAALTGAYQQQKARIHDLMNAIDRYQLQKTAPAPAGKIALLLIDSADMTDIEELDGADMAKAQAEALRQIDVGNAARAVVITLHGEAYRRSAWKEAA